MSFNTAIQHLALSLASLSSGYLIGRGSNGELTRYWLVGLISVACVLTCIWLARRIKAVA